MKLLFSLLLVISTYSVLAEDYFFTVDITSKGATAIKPNEYCRKHSRNDPAYLKKHCVKPTSNGYLCKGSSESWLIQVYDSRKNCEKWLFYAKKKLINL